MSSYDSTQTIFDGLSATYAISCATVLLAVLIALYISNLLKDIGSTTSNANDLARLGQGQSTYENSELSADEADVEENADDTDLEQEQYELNGDTILKGKLDTAKRIKALEAQLTADQLEEERRVEREQLAAIFELLKQQEAKLNMPEIDESELNNQLRLYR